MNKAVIIIIFINCFILNITFASDTLKLTKLISLEKFGREYAPGYLLIDNKIFEIAYAQNNSFFNYISYPYDKYSQVYFRNCNFGVYESSNRITMPIVNSGFYVLDSCNIRSLPVVNVSGDISIGSSLMNGLSIENTKNLRLRLVQDTLVSYIMLQNNENMKFQLDQCAFRDSGEMRSYNTTFSEFNFLYDKRSGCNIYFHNDTINSFLAGAIDVDFDLKNYKHNNTFAFYQCHINAPFIFFENIPNSTFVFNNCTFGSNANLSDMAVDNLVIRNCRNFPEQIMIGFRDKDKKVQLSLVNSNLDNVRFDFASNIKLIFDSTDSKDVITNSYKNLLEKFEHEGKARSYRLVDLQYRRLNDNNFFHFLNCIWWYHGYMPGLVFAWTALFLLMFFYFNKKCWGKIYETYPLKNGQNAATYNKPNNKFRFYSAVLLYTLFIFFSLRIDFSKLNFRHLGFVYFLLCQYIVGLWCMIFILRFVFKL